MNLQISGRHIEVTPAIHDYALEKIGRVVRHFDHVIDANVTLSVEKLKQRAEVTVRMPGKDVHVEADEADLYAAIDALADKLDRQIQRSKEKLQNHRGQKANVN